MIHELVSVCLLSMGVGAKASTPIELNRQPQYEQQQNESGLTFSNTFNPSQAQNFQLYYAHPGTPQYQLLNWSYDTVYGTTNQYTFSNIQYTQAELAYDPNNENDVWEYKLETFQNNGGINDWYDKMEVLSITPSQTVYDTKLYKSVVSDLITVQNINAQFTLKLEMFYSNTGSLDNFKELDTNQNVINSSRNAMNQIQMYAYTYEERYVNFNVSETTPTRSLNAEFEFNIPLIKDTNTVIVLFYKLYCTNVENEGWNSRVIDQTSQTNNGIYSQAIKTYETTLSGNWSTATVNQEVIDLPGLMWEILAMPFAFISTAFNLTLFPGTPYSLNITNLFMALILMAIIVFILKKVVKL